MRNFSKVIVTIFLIFSIKNTFGYNQWIIEDILNSNYWPTSYNLSLETLDIYSFKSTTLRYKYNQMVEIDSKVRDLIMQKFENDDYSYVKANAIVNNYKNFVYYTNQFFYYLSLMDKNPNLKYDSEIQTWFLDSYKLSVSTYKKVKNLINE